MLKNIALSHVVTFYVPAADIASKPNHQYYSDSDIEIPDPKRSRKWSGAATYKTKFSKTWISEFPFISSVRGDQYR